MSIRLLRILTAGLLAALIACLSGGGAPSVRAQNGGLVVAPSGPNLTPAQIAQSLGGPGVAITNVTYSGDARALGIFSGGTGILGANFESGIMVSSGQVTDAVGPNDSDNTTTNFGTPGDPDLDQIVQPLTTTFDAAVLEFDVTPRGRQVQFKYVFASEEYNEFANSAFNNVFAFFVGTGANRVNCAVLPDGTPASINNINIGNIGGTGDPTPRHPQFFRNNDASEFFPNPPPINIEGDGLTTELTCTAAVTPGVANHFKIAIADSGDSVLDTWVFIKAETLSVSETVPPDAGAPDPRLSAAAIVTEFTPGGGEDQTQQFTFDNLGLVQNVALQVTQHQTLANLTLNATVTLHTQDELSQSIVNPDQFPPGTVCVTARTNSGEEACLEVSVVDAATGEFPSANLYNGPIRWEITVDKDSLTPDVAYGMAHFEGSSTSLPENIIVSFDAGLGESDNYSDIVLTESPLNSAPILRVPADFSTEATSPSGAVVNYMVLGEGVHLATSPFLPIYTHLRQNEIQCVPASGSTFSLGTTRVDCTATGENNMSTPGFFNVTVVDTTPPTITAANIKVPATSASGAVVNYMVTATDLVDTSVILSCAPPSGSLFPLGTTTVQCTATDSRLNTANASFTVTVGCCDVEVTVSPSSASRGQTVKVTALASNYSNKLRVGPVKFALTTPCRPQEVMGSFPVILLPGKKVTITVPFRIPNQACLGPYTFETTATFSDGSTSHHVTVLTVVP